jgi:DNA-directed RNA polymerase subunit omega
MLNPNIGKLIMKSENRYRLVLDVAKTARDISGEAAEKGEIIVEKPVSVAIDKLASEL